MAPVNFDEKNLKKVLTAKLAAGIFFPWLMTLFPSFPPEMI
jgi:hypothetical protein